MTSFADEGGGAADGAAGGNGAAGGIRVFVGSFNINSQDLTIEAARAWLSEAQGADIVALGLQECATVPANPFPEPTNGKAVAMWKHVKDFAIPKVSNSTDNGGGNGRSSAAMAGITQAAMAAASATNRKTKKPRPPSSPGGSGTDSLPPVCEKSGGGCAGVDQGQERESSSSSGDLECSEPIRLGDQGGNGNGNGSNGKGMRQESYYLRGAIDEDRERDLLANIAECIPGRSLIADVAMGETPTHGKIKVDISKNYPKTPPISRESSYSAAAAVQAACKEAVGSSSEGLGLDSAAGDGPLDASGRPGWAVGDSGKGVSFSVDSSGKDDNGGDADTDASGGAVFKTVEWYGTIRLLVFARKGLHKKLSVRTVVIPAGDKPSVVADAPEDYAKDTSPDKGAVACYLEDLSSQSPLQLLLVNCHLYGTNKYGVQEAVFDKYRLAQLRAIDLALKAALPTATAAPLVLFGDLNFRVEMLSGAEDKVKGGNDFQEVRKLAETCDSEVLLGLYNRADRLRPLLEGGKGEVRDSPFMATEKMDQPGTGHETTLANHERVPSLLEGLKDGLKASLLKGQAIRPTFTYKPGDTSSTRRRFNEKRTPSWTDRILWRGFADGERDHSHSHSHLHQEQEQKGVPAGELQQHSNTIFSSVQEVISSDHEPVYCVLDLPRTKPAP
eukprot:g17739.t1